MSRLLNLWTCSYCIVVFFKVITRWLAEVFTLPWRERKSWETRPFPFSLCEKVPFTPGLHKHRIDKWGNQLVTSSVISLPFFSLWYLRQTSRVYFLATYKHIWSHMLYRFHFLPTVKLVRKWQVLNLKHTYNKFNIRNFIHYVNTVWY